MEAVDRFTEAVAEASAIGVKGIGNLVTKGQSRVDAIRKTARWIETVGTEPASARWLPSKRAALEDAVETLVGITAQITERTDAERKRVESRAERPVAAPDAAYVSQARAMIEMLATSTVDVTPSDLLAVAAPEAVDRYVRSRGVWYRRTGAGAIEAAIEDEIAEEIADALQRRQFGRVVGTALDIAKRESARDDDDHDDSTPMSVVPVLRTWASHMRTYTSLYEHLPSDESLRVCDDLFPMVIDGAPYTLHRKDGRLTHEPPPDCNVLYPAIECTSTGESRALDAMVAHHFKTDDEVEAFYTTCGISLFGYGIPNLVFLLGSGGSGKDALFSLMRSVHGERLVCTLNALALMGHDEANDLVRLQSARFALCSFESSHRADGSFKPSNLKSITSGGQNPITARAKYARAAVDIYYRGSLWLYGNRVPNLTGGGDFDGLDRRFMILPMQKRLPEVPPPKGFTTWSEAIVACAPVFAHRCLARFQRWHENGAVGYSDVRRRIPDEWRELSHEHLMAGSRFGFLRDLFMPSDTGLRETTVFDVMGAIMKQEGIRIGRSRFHEVLKDTISDSARFDGMRHMEAEDRGGVRHLPVTVVPSTLHRLLDSLHLTDALHALRSDGAWMPDVVEVAHRFNREAQLRARLYGGAE